MRGSQDEIFLTLVRCTEAQSNIADGLLEAGPKQRNQSRANKSHSLLPLITHLQFKSSQATCPDQRIPPLEQVSASITTSSQNAAAAAAIGRYS